MYPTPVIATPVIGKMYPTPVIVNVFARPVEAGRGCLSSGQNFWPNRIPNERGRLVAVVQACPGGRTTFVRPP
jgi:hypothetical protein